MATVLSISVEVNPMLNGMITGGGFKSVGDTVTLTPVPYKNKYFKDWNLPDGTISTTNPLTFTAATSGTYKANFQHYFSVKVNQSPMGSVTGENLAAKNTDTITLAATPNSGHSFVGYFERGNLLSSATTYAFTTSIDRVIDAVFQNTEEPTHLTSGHFVYPPINVTIV